MEIDPEWLERRAAVEGDLEIGVKVGLGRSLFPPLLATLLRMSPVSDDAHRLMLSPTDAEVPPRFGADLDRIFGEEPAAHGGTDAVKGKSA